MYYKRDGSQHWLGPAIVIFQDGKVIFFLHGAALVRVSKNRLIKAGQVIQRDIPVNLYINRIRMFVCLSVGYTLLIQYTCYIWEEAEFIGEGSYKK